MQSVAKNLQILNPIRCQNIWLNKLKPIKTLAFLDTVYYSMAVLGR